MKPDRLIRAAQTPTAAEVEKTLRFLRYQCCFLVPLKGPSPMPSPQSQTSRVLENRSWPLCSYRAQDQSKPSLTKRQSNGRSYPAPAARHPLPCLDHSATNMPSRFRFACQRSADRVRGPFAMPRLLREAFQQPTAHGPARCIVPDCEHRRSRFRRQIYEPQWRPVLASVG